MSSDNAAAPKHSIPHYAIKAITTRHKPPEGSAAQYTRLCANQQAIVAAVADDSWPQSPWCESFTTTFVEAVKQAKVYVDVGAELGFYVALAARYMPSDAIIQGLEPDPLRAAIIAHAFDEDPRITIHPVAAHDCEATLTLTKPREQSATLASVEGDTFTCTADTMDRFLAQELAENIPIDVIKMDIEGAEAHAFAGMEGILSRRTATIFLELHYWVDTLYPGGMAHMESLLSRHGYSIWQADTLPLTRVASLKDTGLRFVLRPDADPQPPADPQLPPVAS